MPVQLSVKATGAEVVRKGLADLEAAVPKIARKDIYDMMRAALKTLRTPGKRITYPVKWDSERQRRYVLALLRSQNNLPYRRTDELPRGWTIEKLDKGYRLYNPSSAAVYVYGDFEGARQSRIHQQRWPLTQEIVEKEIQGLPPLIEQHISYYGRQVLE